MGCLTLLCQSLLWLLPNFPSNINKMLYTLPRNLPEPEHEHLWTPSKEWLSRTQAGGQKYLWLPYFSLCMWFFFFFFVEPVCPFLCKQATFHRVFGRAYNMFVTVLCHLKEGIILHAAVQMQWGERPSKEPICSEIRFERVQNGAINWSPHDYEPWP